MNKNNNFDKFLKRRFQKSVCDIKNDGFTEKVLSKLPITNTYSIKRNLIIYALGILSVLIFFISEGFNLLIYSINEVVNKSKHLITPSFLSIFVIIVFLGMIAYLSSIEYDRKTI